MGGLAGCVIVFLTRWNTLSQRAPPKTFDQQLSNLQGKITAKEEAILEVRGEIKALKREARASKDPKVAKYVCPSMCVCMCVRASMHDLHSCCMQEIRG